MPVLSWPAASRFVMLVFIKALATGGGYNYVKINSKSQQWKLHQGQPVPVSTVPAPSLWQHKERKKINWRQGNTARWQEQVARWAAEGCAVEILTWLQAADVQQDIEVAPRSPAIRDDQQGPRSWSGSERVLLVRGGSENNPTAMGEGRDWGNNSSVLQNLRSGGWKLKDGGQTAARVRWVQGSFCVMVSKVFILGRIITRPADQWKKTTQNTGFVL